MFEFAIGSAINFPYSALLSNSNRIVENPCPKYPYGICTLNPFPENLRGSLSAFLPLYLTAVLRAGGRFY